MCSVCSQLSLLQAQVVRAASSSADRNLDRAGRDVERAGRDVEREAEGKRLPAVCCGMAALLFSSFHLPHVLHIKSKQQSGFLNALVCSALLCPALPCSVLALYSHVLHCCRISRGA